jgi:transcription initiation factor IIF auxiliary subunit
MAGLRLRNSWEHQGEDWWKWSAFLDDGGSGELGNVDRVEYVLHPSFNNPVREVSDPAGGFAMDTAGWGTFPLKAVVYTKDGKKQVLTHEVQLEEGTGKSG